MGSGLDRRFLHGNGAPGGEARGCHCCADDAWANGTATHPGHSFPPPKRLAASPFPSFFALGAMRKKVPGVRAGRAQAAIPGTVGASPRGRASLSDDSGHGRRAHPPAACLPAPHGLWDQLDGGSKPLSSHFPAVRVCPCLGTEAHDLFAARPACARRAPMRAHTAHSSCSVTTRSPLYLQPQLSQM